MPKTIIASLQLIALVLLAGMATVAVLDLMGHMFLVACGMTGADAWPWGVQALLHIGRWA